MSGTAPPGRVRRHARTAPASDAANPPATVNQHYPQNRHNGVYNVLYCDGHTAALTPNDLTTGLFLASGDAPTFP